MFQFDIQKWIPKFIWNDRNGHALAMAINAGLQMLNDSAAEGLKLINDYDDMPEWRLDELAWETNCLYDYNAPIETKRQWIKNALPFYKLYGTPMAIYQYLGSYFDKVDLQENWEYDGEPYHFRVTVEGEWTPDNETWSKKAIETAKNVRSVLDSMRVEAERKAAREAELAPAKKAADMRKENAKVIAEHDDMLAELLFEITVNETEG